MAAATQGSEYPLYWHPERASDLLSIGNLQHAPMASHIWQPGYAIGNAYADPLIARDHYSGLFDENGYYYQTPATSNDLTPGINDLLDNSHIDISHVLNASLWDDYFLSGLPEQGGELVVTAGQLAGTQALPNSRMRLVKVDGAGYDALADAQEEFDGGAKYLQIAGAFNVNSTSVNAWRALLGGALGVEVGGTDPVDEAVFPRWPQPMGGLADADGVGTTMGGHEESYQDARTLDMDDIDALAQAIVDQVRLRGPFLSLGDFVNRRLIPANADPEGTGLRGALQAAIDSTDINAAFINSGDSATYVDADSLREEQVIPDHVLAGEGRYSTMAGAPLFLTQADLLSALGLHSLYVGIHFAFARTARGGTRCRVRCRGAPGVRLWFSANPIT